MYVGFYENRPSTIWNVNHVKPSREKNLRGNKKKKNSHTHSLTLVLFSKWIWSEEKPAPAFYWYVIWFTMFAKHLQRKSETSIQWNFESGIGTKGKHFGIAWAKEGLLFLSQFTVYSTVFSLSHSLAMDFFLRTVSAWNSSIQRC